MNKFEKEIENFLGKSKYKKIHAARIGIAGLGGLGSNCAFNLARTGFKHFILADFDTVNHSNLNRQFYFQNQIGQKKTKALKQNLLKINPAINTELHSIFLSHTNSPEIFKSCDIIVEAFDCANSKAMLCESFINTDKFIVSASGIAGYGKTDTLRVHKIKNNFYVVGDLKTKISLANSPLSPRVNIAAAKQADIVLEYVLNGKIT
ncbi:MAG: sulfur carrier protein ThiS adenylyltransferase ThiF [Elusimicrobia bacterium]|nr:sulfur carrier protein ThiS adenylyltransferase ThiF [Elusimicrobiota bacterium]